MIRDKQIMEDRYRCLEKEKNQWKDATLKLRVEIESKISNLQTLKNHPVLKQPNSTTYEQENNSLRSNKAV